MTATPVTNQLNSAAENDNDDDLLDPEIEGKFRKEVTYQVRTSKILMLTECSAA